MTPHAATSGHPAVPRLDADRGISLLMSFVGALVVIVADIIAIAAVGSGWILIPGVALFWVMSAIVFRRIMRLLADSGDGGEQNAHRPADDLGAL